MKIYKLYLDSKHHAVMTPVNDKDKYSLWTYNDFKKIKNNFLMKKVDSELKNLKLPIADFAVLGREFPFMLSEKAYSFLKSSINKSDELREVKVDDESAYIYWPSKVIDCLDVEKSDINVLPGGYKHLVKPVFDKSNLKDGLIFIVPQFMTDSLFLTEDVAKQIFDSDLTGYNLVDANLPRKL